MKHFYLLFFTTLFFQIGHVNAQSKLTGIVLDAKNLDPIPGANVIIESNKQGTTTDFDGKFELITTAKLPIKVTVSFIGYKKATVTYDKAGNQRILMQSDETILQEVSVVERRLSEKQKESALTVEALDILAIKETPSISFYEGLGNLKGVDLTSASIGFKVINTRGFNSTSPVRSLQIIDGVDNQAPGLNFSLGNFLGASELDILNVDIIAGASSAFYGPNAFNGVISMTTKNPFEFQGLSASVKTGERRLGEYAVRWADAIKNKKGEEKFAYKLNFYYLHADDWVADNMNPVDGTALGRENFGGYDAVNRYGDETVFDDGGSTRSYAGIGQYTRDGIEEIHLVDYDTRNMKLGTSLHYRIKKDLELSYGLNYGTGTTVYQGDNRFSLKGIQFFQNKIQLEKKNKWFVRAYATNEDAGQSYDAYFTALRMQESYLDEGTWASNYRGSWNSNIIPLMRNYFGSAFPNLGSNPPNAAQIREAMILLQQQDPDFFRQMHARNRDVMTQSGWDPPLPGTAAFDSLFSYVTSRPATEGGSMLVDRSALYHAMGQYQFDETSWGKFTVGANVRQYRPVSDGTIFSDTNGRVIINNEAGGFVGWEKKSWGNKLKTSATVRLDKNQNFNLLSSQALSFVYQYDEINTFRLSFSSAIRNPTLQDQYLNYNVGRAILLGNLTGYDSLVTVENVTDFLGASPADRQNYNWDYFSVDAVRPERVQTIEAGYRTTLWNAVYVDLNYYYNWYRDFIGFVIGLDIDYDPNSVLGLVGAQAYRISANAQDRVTTQGFSAGLSYYFADYYALTGNYTWNVLNSQSDDPIIPAFNTPEHKYNIGFSARELSIPSLRLKHLGFNVTYKWIQGFIFEGSPQFTGFIDSYDLLDAQISYGIPKANLTLKMGSSNIFNKRVFQVYGGPRVGRLSYLSLVLDLEKKNK